MQSIRNRQKPADEPNYSDIESEGHDGQHHDKHLKRLTYTELQTPTEESRELRPQCTVVN